ARVEKTLAAWHFLFASFRRRTAVLFQFIVQRLEADAKNLRRSGLVVAGCLQRFQDQHPLCFLHGSPHTQPNGVGIVGGGPQWGLSKSRRKMLSFNGTGIADNNGAFDRVTQFTYVSR